MFLELKIFNDSIFCLSLSHRLEYFQNFHLQSIMGEDWVQPESDLWKGKAWASPNCYFSFKIIIIIIILHRDTQSHHSSNRAIVQIVFDSKQRAINLYYLMMQNDMTRNALSACHTMLDFTHICAGAQTHTSHIIEHQLKLPEPSVTYSAYDVLGDEGCSFWHSAPV